MRTFGMMALNYGAIVQGDSGGPLQVKLLHNAKVTPFVVAVTSFGSACGQSTPGVYTKVSKYAPWIRSVIAAHETDAEGGKIFSWITLNIE